MIKNGSISEMAIQQIWLEKNFDQNNLQTVCGQPVIIEFSGWHNIGSGPDFKEAHLQIGDQALFGGVEIHLQTSGWYSHQHQSNPDYNEVILHVVLYHSGNRTIERADGRKIPELELAPFLIDEPSCSSADAKLQLEKMGGLPGRCGIAVTEQGAGILKKILGHAAEKRIQEKMKILLERWEEQHPEELLFQLLFKSLGYSPFSQVFEELAKQYQFKELRPFFRQPQRTARTMVLSRWFGACGLFNNKNTIADPTVRHEFQQWRDAWIALEDQPRVSGKNSLAHRPQNSPERRLMGMYHHLCRVANEGLLKRWLVTLSKLAAFTDEKKLRKHVLTETDQLFSTPDWEVWQKHLVMGQSTQTKSTQLVGKDRQIIIWANALLPFFLAYARQGKELQLEKLLFRLFMILPAEASNRNTRFMQKRLWYSEMPKSPKLNLNTFGNRQGLIQIHQDFCRNFYQGCVRCELPGLLEG